MCLGYRFEYQGKIFCTAYDTDPFHNVFCNDPNNPHYDQSMFDEGELAAKEENERLEKFCRDADLLVYDTQYTQVEYDTGKKGWGHSSIETAIDMAKRNRVKRLALFHHDPLRNDDELDKLSKLYCNPFPDSNLRVFFAREGTQIIL